MEAIARVLAESERHEMSRLYRSLSLSYKKQTPPQKRVATSNVRGLPVADVGSCCNFSRARRNCFSVATTCQASLRFAPLCLSFSQRLDGTIELVLQSRLVAGHLLKKSILHPRRNRSPNRAAAACIPSRPLVALVPWRRFMPMPYPLPRRRLPHRRESEDTSLSRSLPFQ